MSQPYSPSVNIIATDTVPKTFDIYYKGIRVFNDIENRDQKALFFLENDYLILKDILTEDIKKYLQENIRFDSPTDEPSNPINDKLQFYRQHNDAGDDTGGFINVLLPFYEFLLNKKLTKMIGFAMKYNSNSELIPHYDNYNMPISSSICYHNEGNIEYPIYMDKAYFNNPHPFRLTVYDKDGIPEENRIKIVLNAGDIVVFRGRNHLHWRDKKHINDWRAVLVHTEDYTYNGELLSYIHDNTSIKSDIREIKNISTYALTDVDSYDKFRKIYAMHFKNT
jgi:hypothetical protein